MALRPKKRSRFLALLLACTLPALSQTLAHRNWEGSGLTAQAWWTRATFCDIDRRKGMHDVTSQLDDLQSIGCEALVLDILSPDNASPAALTSGTLDDADDLIDQMSRRKLRLVLPLPIASPAETPALLDRMRFWLSRGVAGFLLRCRDGSTSAGDTALLHQAHQVASAALGTRVLIAEGITSPTPSTAAHRASDAQLAIRRVLLSDSAATLRAKLSAKATPYPVLAAEPEPAETPLNLDQLRLQAAMLLGNGAAALLPAEALTVSGATHRTGAAPLATPSEDAPLWVPQGGDPLGPTPHDELLKWLRALAELRRTSPSLRNGETIYLNHDSDGILAWIVRPRGSGPALLFVCNLAGHPIHVSLASDLRLLAVKGTFLHTVLTTESTAPHATLDAIDLAKGGALAGEIR